MRKFTLLALYIQPVHDSAEKGSHDLIFVKKERVYLRGIGFA